MSFSGGTFSINTTGQPVVQGTTISALAFNALTADLATGLSTCMLKDGTQTATAGIGFYAGTVSLPGIYFGTDTATGLYRIGLNNTGYSINGTKLLDLSAALFAVTGAATVSTTLGVTGATTLTGGLVLPGTAANITLGSNYISNGGTDAGFSLDASNNATFSGSLTAAAGSFTTLAASGIATLDANVRNGLTVDNPISSRVNGNVLFSAGGFQMRMPTASAIMGVDATSGTHLTFYTDNGVAVAAGNINSSGSTTTYTTASDTRLKNDLGVSSDTSVLRGLRVHDFEWKETGQRALGVFAQEAHKVFPAAVSIGGEDARTQPWTVSYASFVPSLIVGWQDHESKLTAILAELIADHADLASLRKALTEKR